MRVITNATLRTLTDRVGTLAEGTDADVVVWDGEPFQLETGTRHVFIDGKHVYDRERDDTDPREDWQW